MKRKGTLSVLALCLATTLWVRPPLATEGPSTWRPLRAVAADLCWIRFAQARRDGDLDLALIQAERALALHPERTGGWIYLASYLGLNRASREHEPDAARRASWIDAALELCRRGRATCSEPEELALRAGLILFVHGEQSAEEPELARAYFRRAAEALDEAVRLGHPDAPELAEAARRAGG